MRKLFPLFSFFIIYSSVALAGATGVKPTFAQSDIFQSANFIKNAPGLIKDYKGRQILFFSDHDGVCAFFTNEGPVYKLTKLDPKKAKEQEHERERSFREKHESKEEREEEFKAMPTQIGYVSVHWIGANPNPQIEGGSKNAGNFLYLAGKTKDDLRTIAAEGYKKIVYRDLYPGIDVEYSFPDRGGIKYDLIVHPGADPGQIKMEYQGAIKKMQVDASGNLTIHTETGDVIEHTPVSFTAGGKQVLSSYNIQGNVISFSLPKGYDTKSTLTIDPWITTPTQLTIRNLGTNVDYDVPGNLYVYGAGGGSINDTTNYQKVAKYSFGGTFLWVFNGSVPSVSWNTTGGSGGDLISNAKIDRINGKVYAGQALGANGTQVIRLNSAGVYDNFISNQDTTFREVWSFTQNCASGDVIAQGGGISANLNMAIISPSLGTVTTTNMTGIAANAGTNGIGTGQDIVSGTYDSLENLYVVMASDATPAVNNVIYKVNSTYNGNVWGPINTGYATFSEADNLPGYDNTLYSCGFGCTERLNSNNFNALAANGDYLYYYDGKHLKAFSLSTGAAVGTAVTIAGFTAKWQGGIAVDNCNNVYLGGKGSILTYTFNGTTFTAGTAISLGAGYTTDTVNDVRYDALNNLLYVTGTRLVGTYTASLSTNCILPVPFTDTINSLNANCFNRAYLTINPDSGLFNPSFLILWQDSLGNTLQTTGPGTALTDSFLTPYSGKLIVQVELNENCGNSALIKDFYISICQNLLAYEDTTVCAGQPVTLSAIGYPAGGAYLWEPGGATTSSITVTPATTTSYTVKYTPTTGSPPTTDTVTVTVTTAVAVSASDTSVCAGQAATLTATPTIGGGTYSWAPGGATTQTITVTPATTTDYTVTYTTAHCGTATAIGIDTVSAVPTVSVNSPAICAGGTTTLTATPSVAGGSYSWAPGGATTQTISVSPGSTTTYTVTYVTPGCGSTTGTGTVTVSPSSTVSVNSDTVCPGNSAILTATTSQGGGTYSWSPGTGTGASITVSPASNTTYTVTYLVPGCSSVTASGSVDIAQAPTVTVNDTALCPGQNGFLTASSPSAVTYNWSPVGATTQTISVVPVAATYTVTVTNAATCTATASGAVTVNAAPSIAANDAVICAGSTATITATGGVSYVWSTSATGPTITTTTAGTYTVTATGANGCTASVNPTVTINPQPTATVSTISATCTADNGYAIAQPAAGTPAYTYAWSNPGGTGDTLSALAPGSYTVTVTDANLCTATASGTVGVTSGAITVTELSQHNLKCNGDGTGDIYISATDNGGAGPYTYTYAWSNSANTQNLTNVPAGPYTVTVTDQNGCSGSASYTLSQPAALSATASQVNPHCSGAADGSATATPSGGSGNYSYTWNTTPAQATQQATGLAAGSYTVTVTDDSLCQYVLTVTLVDPAAITFAAPVYTEPSCYGGNNGSIQVSPQNGVGTYSYQWSDPTGQTTDPATNLVAGSYTVTVTDANGCTATASLTLSQPSQIAVTVTETDPACFGYNNGTATASASNGTAPYDYVWNNSATTASLTNLGTGTYTVTVTDHNGCSTTGTTTLSQPAATSETLAATRTNCSNSTDGSITVTAAGGTGTFTYTLANATGTVLQSGNTSGQFTGLGGGLYTVTGQDQNGCTISDTVSVPAAPANVYTATADTTSCYGSQYNDGIIHLQGYQIPNGPFKYSVDGGAFQYVPDFYNLSAGPHTVVAQDNFGCDTTFTVIVGEPLPATVQILPGDSTITPGTSLQLSTAFSPYSTDSIKGYTWSPAIGLSCMDCPNPVASPYLDQTIYSVVITYNNGCTTTASVQINTNGQPPVYIPNAFTPNGDGIDDMWLVFGTGIKDFSAKVFNRWGEKIFEADNQSSGWDGTYRGQMQPTGVYVYVVDLVYLSGQSETKEGSITLIR